MITVKIRCLLKRPFGEAVMLATYFPRGDRAKTEDMAKPK